MSPPSPDSRVRLSVMLGHITYVGRDYGCVRIPPTVEDVRFTGGHLISLHHTTVGPAESKRWAVTCQGHLVTSATYWQILMEASLSCHSTPSVLWCPLHFPKQMGAIRGPKENAEVLQVFFLYPSLEMIHFLETPSNAKQRALLCD